MFNATAPVHYRGVPFHFNGQTIIVPALSYDQAEEHATKIDQCTDPSDALTADQIMGMSSEAFKVHADKTRVRRRLMKEIIGVAIKRNYPDFSAEELAAFVDFDNGQAAFNAALGYTKDAAKITDPGEWKPAVSAGQN